MSCVIVSCSDGSEVSVSVRTCTGDYRGSNIFHDRTHHHVVVVIIIVWGKVIGTKISANVRISNLGIVENRHHYGHIHHRVTCMWPSKGPCKKSKI